MKSNYTSRCYLCILAERQPLYFGRRLFLSMVFIFALVLSSGAPARNVRAARLADPNFRRQRVQKLTRRSMEHKKLALQTAGEKGWVAEETVDGTKYELQAIRDGRPLILMTCNRNAGVSIAADLVRQAAPYDVNGSGVMTGLWDGGHARYSHNEFTNGRVKEMSGHEVDEDGSSALYDPKAHSTHVAGTIGATGLDQGATGMATGVFIDSYNWDNDLSEATSRAMAVPNEPNSIAASNHSYGHVCGWAYGSWSGTTGWHWHGTWGNRESDYFGSYDETASDWDQLCYDTKYYLPVRSAGNDRGSSNNSAPAENTKFWYWGYKFPLGWDWRSKNYKSATDPWDDYWDNGGFDTIIGGNASKNILLVGAVKDAVTAGERDLSKADMTEFSAWGPTDDGRIKPDVVTNGKTIYSTGVSTDSSYYTSSGTSHSSPGACGAAALIIELYSKHFPAQAMLASTLKGLLIDTADDLGKPGPDYKFGWGLINTKKAADQIFDYARFPCAGKIIEDSVNDVNTTRCYPFYADANIPVRATLCWTDPPAAALSGLDDDSPRLINDLDVRITDPNGDVYYPFILNSSSPNSPAAAGDNTIDNVEQVLIPQTDLPGTYWIEVSYKNSLTNNHQDYSLIVSGQSAADVTGDGLIDNGDLCEIAVHWLEDAPSVDIWPTAGDGIVNLRDFARFAQSRR